MISARKNMRDFIKQSKRELFFAVAIFMAFELSLIPSQYGYEKMAILAFGIGMLIPMIWILGSFVRYADFDPAGLTETILKNKLKKRFSVYVTIPLLSYLTTSVYLFVSISDVLSQVVILIMSVLNLALFVHVKGAYHNEFQLTRHSRGVFNLLDIMSFYLISSSVTYVVFDARLEVLLIAMAGGLLLLHQLIIHQQVNADGMIILLVSGLFLTSCVYVLQQYVHVLVMPILISNVFYLIVSWWNLRLDGIRGYDEYMLPLIYALISTMIVMNF